ncbi:hypothetical protein RUM43_003380 [Polyplax serrata]|uniref:Uncharacterized protein n=1 Tax=Polyplax serrata TaxID=468196 RepID=A0AAN8PEG2_POLSC
MGAKKKNKANKLSRMSEEEKMRYLQHRAAIEEENKRRKEQLISTFLKACHKFVNLQLKFFKSANPI